MNSCYKIKLYGYCPIDIVHPMIIFCVSHTVAPCLHMHVIITRDQSILSANFFGIIGKEKQRAKSWSKIDSKVVHLSNLILWLQCHFCNVLKPIAKMILLQPAWLCNLLFNITFKFGNLILYGHIDMITRLR